MQRMALFAGAVEAVFFIGWMSAQCHFGADARGTDAVATLFDLARPHHPLLARLWAPSQTPICRLTWSQKRRPDQLCLCGRTWSIGWSCPNRHRPSAELARSSFYGLDTRIRALSGWPGFITMDLVQCTTRSVTVVGGGANPPGSPGLRARRLQPLLDERVVAQVHIHPSQHARSHAHVHVPTAPSTLALVQAVVGLLLGPLAWAAVGRCCRRCRCCRRGRRAAAALATAANGVAALTTTALTAASLAAAALAATALATTAVAATTASVVTVTTATITAVIAITAITATAVAIAAIHPPPPLHRLWCHRPRRACRMRLGTAQCHSNAPRIAPVRLSFVEKPSSYPHPILTPRQPPSRYPSYTTSTSHQPLSRPRSFCMRISTVHSRPIAPLITSYLPPLTSQHLPYHLSDRPSRHPPTHRFRLFMSAERAGRSRSPCMRSGTALCRSNAPGIMPTRLRLAE